MKKKKTETIKSLAIHSKDVGSAEVQVGLLTRSEERRVGKEGKKR